MSGLRAPKRDRYNHEQHIGSLLANVESNTVEDSESDEAESDTSMTPATPNRFITHSHRSRSTTGTPELPESSILEIASAKHVGVPMGNPDTADRSVFENENVSGGSSKNSQTSAGTKRKSDLLAGVESKRPKTSESGINRGGRSYVASRSLRPGGGARAKAKSSTANQFYHRGIAKLFKEKEKAGIYSFEGILGHGFFHTFTNEFNAWTEAVQLMTVPKHIYIDRSLWGNRANSLKFQSNSKYGKANPDLVTSKNIQYATCGIRRFMQFCC